MTRAGDGSLRALLSSTRRPVLTVFVSFLNHGKVQRAGETVASGDHSCGEAASKCGGDSAPVGRVAGALGPREPRVCPLYRLPQDPQDPFWSSFTFPFASPVRPGHSIGRRGRSQETPETGRKLCLLIFLSFFLARNPNFLTSSKASVVP